MAEVFTLQSSEIASHWSWIEPFLDRIPDPGWTPEGVKQDLEESQAQLWGMIENSKPVAIWVTKIETTRASTRGLLWIAAGESLEAGLALFMAHTEPWLKEKGCTSVYIVGRRGWGRVLSDYAEVATMFSKEL